MSKNFTKEIINFNKFDKETILKKEGDINYFINEYWTSKQRQSHSIHEISYRACFKAQLPEFFIERLSEPGDRVMDPFMGRGTSLIQSALMGRIPIGNDINPLSTLLTRPRLNPISLESVSKALKTVDWNDGEIKRKDLLVFYHPTTLKKLEALKKWLSKNDHLIPEADWIRMVSINRLSGHSPGFFSGRSMPPNQAVSIKAQEKINKKFNISPPEKDIESIIIKKTKSLIRDGTLNCKNNYIFIRRNAWDIPDIEDQSITLTVTSPPFLDVVQYAEDNWLRWWFTDIDPNDVSIAMHKTCEQWSEMIYKVLVEQARILKHGGHIAIEVGEVRNGTILLEKLVWKAAQNLPFERLGVMINNQNFTKTANCWGIKNGKKGTNTNRIVLLKRL